MLVVLEV
jgi:hypothetical protein